MLSARAAWALAALRHSLPDDYGFVIYPEAGGLLCWGMDGGGGVYHWVTSAPDPDRWTICIEGRPLGPDVQCHDLTLTSYLEALIAGTIQAAALVDWPRPNSKIECRVAPSGH